MIKFYTDGAYSSSRDLGGIGIIGLKDDLIILRYSKQYEHTTNNRMELRAIIHALNFLRKPVDKVVIVTDSQYVIGCATKGWKRKKNADLWEKYDSAFKRASVLCSDITFEWVHGHNNDKYNELCDTMAVKMTQ